MFPIDRYGRMLCPTCATPMQLASRYDRNNKTSREIIAVCNVCASTMAIPLTRPDQHRSAA